LSSQLSGECYAKLEEWLVSEDAAGLQHGELEVRGRELLRRLYQDRPVIVNRTSSP
jgi:hypothetical protein